MLLKRCLYTQEFYLFIVTFFFTICSFTVFLENCILLPKGINEFVVFHLSDNISGHLSDTISINPKINVDN
jgi:hypothetical protein